MRVLVVTGSRSEYGLLEPVFRALAQQPGLEPQLAVTGTHLLAAYGATVEAIRDSGVPIACEIPCYEPEDGADLRDSDAPTAVARVVEGVGRAIADGNVDAVLVLGDRAEAMGAALAGYAAGVLVIHLHGGEVTESGHVDEGYRHAITRLAHVHFAATAQSAARLQAMGEEEWRIFCVGAPGLDNVVASRERWLEQSAQERSQWFRQRYAPPRGDRCALLLFHPHRLEQDLAEAQVREILRALEQREVGVVAVYPNSDPGSAGVIRALREAESHRPDFVAGYPSLPREDFHRVLLSVDFLIGNSSAGIIEAPAMGVPVINVGLRNRDREHGSGIDFVAPEARALQQAIDRVSVHTRRPAADHPYGVGGASREIARILAQLPSEQLWLGKGLTLNVPGHTVS